MSGDRARDHPARWRHQPWNPHREPNYDPAVEEPQEIGPDIETVLNRVLPETIAAGRIRLLTEHADAVLALRDTHRRVWNEILSREVRVMVLDGLSPRLGAIAATNNLAVRRQDLDAELEEAMDREKETLLRKVRRLVEDAEDEGLILPSAQEQAPESQTDLPEAG